jgi:hypothetical protein
MKDARDRTTAEKDEWPLTPISLFSPFFKGTTKHTFPNLWIPWLEETDLVISFLDRILLNAIEFSSHTTPVRTRNERTKKFEKSLSATYTFDDTTF